MSEGLDGKIKHEKIALSNLKESDKDKDKKNLLYGFYGAKTNEEKKEEIDLLEKQSLELYYKLDDKKTKELELTFNQLKLKVNFSGMPFYLREGKLYSKSNKNFIIYEDKLFRKLHEIQTESNVVSAIQLNNNDLVLATFEINLEFIFINEIHIYRLKDNKYNLIQKIKEDVTGYSPQYAGCINIPKDYQVKYLKEISGNRFIYISSYGFKIYCLNNKNEYSFVLLEEHLENIKIIQEINENKFIFCTEVVYQCGTEFFIEVIELNEITKLDIHNKIWKIEQEKSFGNNFDKENSLKKDKELLESLKLTCKIKEIIKYNRREYYCFSNFIIIKKKYFTIMINNHILIFDLKEVNLLKRYEIINININRHIQIEKWHNEEDNEFFMLIKGNLILFELNKDNNENIDLKVISQLYCPNFDNIKKLNEKNNKFYSFDFKNNSISIY